MHTNTKTKAILKDLEHVELQIPEGFTSRGGELYLSSLEIAKVTGKRHDNILRDIKTEKMKLQPLTSNLRAVDKAFAEEILKGFSEETYREPTGKEHFHVIRDIREETLKLQEEIDLSKSGLISGNDKEPLAYKEILRGVKESHYLDEQGRRYPCYELSESAAYQMMQIGLIENAFPELTLEYKSIACSNALQIEAEVHKLLKDYHVRGEWFSASLEQVEACLSRVSYQLSLPTLEFI